MRIILIAIMVSVAASLCAQPKSQKVEISAGDILNEVIDKQLQYAFDDFTEGVVLHNNGAISKTKLNYNYLLSEMQYIDQQTKDTLALIRDSGITVISISGRKFIPGLKGKEFIELLNDGNISLGVKRSSKLLSMGGKGAYGTTNITTSASSVSTMAVGMKDGVGRSENVSQLNMTLGQHSLSVMEDMEVNMDNFYYLVDVENGKLTLITNVKSFLKVYPKSKATAIEQYVDTNNVNFRKEDDLLKLTSYCNQL